MRFYGGKTDSFFSFAPPSERPSCQEELLFLSLLKRQLSRRGFAVWRTAKALPTKQQTGFLS
jgi:hypothetical protein